jgi:hypothetical protein
MPELVAAIAAVGLIQWALHVAGGPAVSSYVLSVAAGLAVPVLWRRYRGISRGVHPPNSTPSRRSRERIGAHETEIAQIRAWLQRHRE